MGEDGLGGRETGLLALGYSHSSKGKGREQQPCEAPPGCQIPYEIFHKVSVRHAGNRRLEEHAWPRHISLTGLGFPLSLCQIYSLCRMTEGVRSHRCWPEDLSFFLAIGRRPPSHSL